MALSLSNYTATPGVELPGSLKKDFKDVYKMIEERMFKRGVTACDKILKSVPEHGETLALRALCLLSLNRRDDALEGVKASLKSNMK